MRYDALNRSSWSVDPGLARLVDLRAGRAVEGGFASVVAVLTGDAPAGALKSATQPRIGVGSSVDVPHGLVRLDGARSAHGVHDQPAAWVAR